MNETGNNSASTRKKSAPLPPALAVDMLASAINYMRESGITVHASTETGPNGTPIYLLAVHGVRDLGHALEHTSCQQ